MKSSCLPAPSADVRLHSRAFVGTLLLRAVQIVGALALEPDTGIHAKRLAQAQSRDGTAGVDNVCWLVEKLAEKTALSGQPAEAVKIISVDKEDRTIAL